MRNSIYILLSLIIVSCRQNRKSENNAVRNDNTASLSTGDSSIVNPKTIDEIKAVYAATLQDLKLNQLAADSVKYDCAGEKSGTITYFEKDGKLILIKHSYSEYDHFSANDKYFVRDKNLYFAYLQQTVWRFESGNGPEPITTDDITESRFYLIDNQKFKCLEKKYSIKSKSTNNPIPDRIQNKIVDCKNTASLISNFKNLVAFKSKPKGSCLGK